jgi:hypothetical protein
MRSARFGFREAPELPPVARASRMPDVSPECTTVHHGMHPVTGNIVDTAYWRCCGCGSVTTTERLVNGVVTASKSTPCPCDKAE